MVDNSTQLVTENIDRICPEVEVKISQIDNKVTSQALQSLGRQNMREYSKQGNSQKYKIIKNKTKERINQKEKEQFKNKFIRHMKTSRESQNAALQNSLQ